MGKEATENMGNNQRERTAKKAAVVKPTRELDQIDLKLLDLLQKDGRLANKDLAIGVDARGSKHVVGLACGSSENAKVVKDLLATLADRSVDLNVPGLWVIDGSKALRSAIEQRCGDAAHVQRCRIHKIKNVTERLPKDKARQVRCLMTQAFKLDVTKGKDKLKALARPMHKCRHGLWI